MTELLLKIPALAWLVLSALFFAGGEYLSKTWATQPSINKTIFVVLCYALGTLTWLPAMLHKNQLAVMGTIWLLLATIATIVIGVFVFHESLNTLNWIGIILAIFALFLLSQ